MLQTSTGSPNPLLAAILAREAARRASPAPAEGIRPEASWLYHRASTLLQELAAADAFKSLQASAPAEAHRLSQARHQHTPAPDPRGNAAACLLRQGVALLRPVALCRAALRRWCAALALSTMAGIRACLGMSSTVALRCSSQQSVTDSNLPAAQPAHAGPKEQERGCGPQRSAGTPGKARVPAIHAA